MIYILYFFIFYNILVYYSFNFSFKKLWFYWKNICNDIYKPIGKHYDSYNNVEIENDFFVFNDFSYHAVKHKGNKKRIEYEILKN